MARIANKFGGGARTNVNGLHFEQTTSLDTALSNAGYRVVGHEVYDGRTKIGLSVQKYDFYKYFLIPQGIDYTEYNSKKWLPDECYVNLETNKHIFFIYFQQTHLLPVCLYILQIPEISRKKQLKPQFQLLKYPYIF